MARGAVTNAVEFRLVRDASDLAVPGGFDLFHSIITLQHNPPPLIAEILAAAFAGLNPGGDAFFQVPTYERGYRWDIKNYLSDLAPRGGMEMHVLPQSVIFAVGGARRLRGPGGPARWLHRHCGRSLQHLSGDQAGWRPMNAANLPEDGFGAALFLLGHLYRPVDLLGRPGFAVPETKAPCDGDTWFWSDDNAKVFEFLSRPELWNRFPGETGAVLDFVRAMCRAPFIFRRAALPRLERGPGAGAGQFAVHHHALMNIAHDLRRGVVKIGMRFHDQRAGGISFAGHGVEFTAFSGKRFCLRGRIPLHRCDGGRRSRAPLSAPCRRACLRTGLAAGEIAYCYRFNAGAMAFEVEASLEIEPGLAVSDVVLTIGHQDWAMAGRP